MFKSFLAGLALVATLAFVTPVSAAPDVADYAAPAIGGAATGAVASGMLGNVAAIGAPTAAAAGFGIALVVDLMINGNDSLWARGAMGLCNLLGGEQSPADHYQTCR